MNERDDTRQDKKPRGRELLDDDAEEVEADAADDAGVVESKQDRNQMARG